MLPGPDEVASKKLISWMIPGSPMTLALNQPSPQGQGAEAHLDHADEGWWLQAKGRWHLVYRALICPIGAMTFCWPSTVWSLSLRLGRTKQSLSELLSGRAC